MKKNIYLLLWLLCICNSTVLCQPNGNTITMSGSSDHISVPDNAAWDLPGDFTLSVKVKFSVIKWHMLITHHSNSGFEFSYTGHSLLLSPNGFQYCVNPEWTPVLNTWYQLSVTRQGNLFTAYVDGAVLGTNTFTGAIGTDDFPLMIGNYYSPGYNFNGSMDDVSIWNAALSATQLQNMVAGTLTGNEPNLVAFYNMNRSGQGAGLTVTNGSTAGSIFNGTTAGTASTPVFNVVATSAGALNFDGSNDGIIINNSTSVQLNTGTIEAWIKTPNAGGGYRGIIVKQWAYSLFLYDNVLIAYDWTGGATTTGINLADNQWHHVALSFNSNVPGASKIYIDGVLKQTFTYRVTNHSVGVSVGIGSNYSVQNFTGDIDEVRIWNRQLTIEEIQNNINCELALPATGLALYYKLNQGVANSNNSGINTATDLSGNNNTGSLINFALTGSGSNWITGNINGGCAIFGSTYNITSSAGLNGSIAPSGTVSVTSGASQAFTITPNSGYQVAGVLVDGVSVGSISSYSFSNVSAAHTISASFSLIPVPVISLSASSINFGNLGLGFFLTDSIIVTNTGTAPLNISGIVSSDPVYTIVYAKSLITAGDTTHLKIRYNPMIAGSLSATVSITHDATGSPTVISMQGNAVPAGFAYQVHFIPGLTSNLYGATWFNAQIGFVSGANGKIYKTIDGGTTWTLLPFGFPGTLYSIRCIGSELWLFGENGHICVSHDGGQTFVPFNTGTTNAFYDGYFVNGYYGFATGANGTICRYNGSSWQSYNTNVTNNFYAVYAYGTSAWAVGSGGTVCRYNYGTDSWALINPAVSNDLYGVGFWNDNIGYIVGSGGLIYRTINAGTNWTPCNSGINVNIRSIRCFSSNTAWAVCENGDILQTTDGGSSWVRLPLGGFAFQRVDFNEGQGIAICHDGAVVTFQTDHYNGNYNPYYVRRSTGTNYGYQSAGYGTALNAGIGGRYGTVMITTNAGLNWGSTNPYTLEQINCIKVFGNTSFIAGTGGYIAHCNNLGQNWVRFQGIPSSINFHSMAFYSNGTGWAVGTGGTIYFYNGTSLVLYNTGGIQNTFTSVCVIGNIAYAVGTNGIICKFNGTSWINVSPGVSNDFHGCAFVTPLIGYAVGSGGIICKTTDGAATWSIVVSPTTEDLHCVEVGCKLEAMVAGKNGAAYQTTDAGNNWINKSLNRAVDINSISLTDGQGLLAAEDGEVYSFQFGAGNVTAQITAGGPTTFCEGDSITLTASGGSEFIWSNAAISPSITTTQAGTYTVTVSNAAGCSSEKQIDIIVNPKPVILFALQQETCLNAGLITLSATPTGGLFSGPGVSGNIFNPSIAGNGVINVSYTVTNELGCSSTNNKDIMVNAEAPMPSDVSGLTNVCPYVGSGTLLSYSVAPDPTILFYQWSVPQTATIVSGQGTTSILITIDPGFTNTPNKQIKVRALSNCGNSAYRLFYLLAQLPNTASPITGSSSNICSVLGTVIPITFTIPKVIAATSYIWVTQDGTTSITHPNGPGVNDTTIQVTFANGFSTSFVTVQAANDCGISNTRSLLVTRNNPSTPGLISGPANACEYIAPGGLTATYTVAAVPNAASYSWTLPAGVTNVTGQGTNTISFRYPASFTGGIISVMAINNCGISGIRSLSIIRMNPARPGMFDVIQTGNCPGRIYTYTLAAMPSHATSVQWTIPTSAGAVLISGANTTSITVSYPPTVVVGSITATAVNNCGVSAERVLAVKLPACATGFTKTNGDYQTSNAIVQTLPATESFDVNLFPNPTFNAFSLQVNGKANEQAVIKIFDLQGRCLKTMIILSQQAITAGNDLAPGTYLLEVRQGKFIKTVKVVKY